MPEGADAGFMTVHVDRTEMKDNRSELEEPNAHSTPRRS
jgi:hypothetical protein